MTLWLHALGHYHPEAEITNQFLEDLDIGTSDQWIMERVGIRSRRTFMPLDYIRETRNRDPRMALEAATISAAGAARHAAEMALARAGISASEIGMVISGSSAPDTAAPAEVFVRTAVDKNLAGRWRGRDILWEGDDAASLLGREASYLLGVTPAGRTDFCLALETGGLDEDLHALLANWRRQQEFAPDETAGDTTWGVVRIRFQAETDDGEGPP